MNKRRDVGYSSFIILPSSFMDKIFIAKVQHTISRHRMLEDGATVVVAVSGGPDSVALLHVLKQLQRRRYPSLILHVAHLNHRLRGPESDEDEEFVQGLATGLGLGFTSHQQDIRALAREQGRNLEEVAREERYRFLRHVAACLHAHRIATGHTLTDQAETVLMRLIRGAGGEGLTAIHPVIDDLIIRPLLGVTRAEVLAYCEERGAPYRVDRTNLEPTLFRNRIRQDILPQLETLNPSVTESLARAAENLRLDEDYFDHLIPHLMPDCIASRGKGVLSLKIAALHDLHPALRRRALRAALRELRGDLHRVRQSHVEAVERLLQAGMSGRRVRLPGLTVWREFDVLTLRLEGAEAAPAPQDLVENQLIVWGRFRLSVRRGLSQEPSLPAPGAVLLDDAQLPPRLRVRTRRPGDRYVPTGHRQPRKLKRLMMEHKIPVTQRDRWPIVVTADDDHIVWGPHLPVAAPFAPGARTKQFAALQWVVNREPEPEETH
jgi:tRNA(Ile)-lysidine synthase